MILDKITTNDMELALATSKTSPFNFLKNPIVSIRCSDIFGHETDFVSINKSDYATEVEIKISKTDFKNDFKKCHHHESGYIKYFYYAVPYYMVDFAKEHLPEGAGLLMIIPAKPVGKVITIIPAAPKKGVRKITDKIRAKLQRYMSMRYWSLLKRVRKYFWDKIVCKYNIEQKQLKRRSVVK